MTVGTRITWGFCILLGLLVFIGGVSYWCTEQQTAAQNDLRAARLSLLATTEFLAAIKDAQRGQRGFLLTGSDRYLEPYNQALEELPKIRQELEDRVKETGGSTRFSDLDRQVGAVLGELAETIQLYRTQGPEAAIALVKTDAGRAHMTSMLALIGSIRREATTRTDEHQARLLLLSRRSQNVILFGTLFATLFAIAVSVTITRGITGPIRQMVNDLASGSLETRSMAAQQSAGVAQQSSGVNETVATISEVAQTADQAASSARQVAEVSQRSVRVSEEGRQALEETRRALRETQDHSGALAEILHLLSDRATAIGDIIATVTDIADQTNLLALNAAIEASRAGEHGKGFSVVATEVKALADQSKKATVQVRQILGEIQKATGRAVTAGDEGTRSLRRVSELTSQAASTISELDDIIRSASDSAAQIAASSSQQTLGIGQIQTAMRLIQQVTDQNGRAIKQFEESAGNIQSIGQKLQQMVGS